MCERPNKATSKALKYLLARGELTMEKDGLRVFFLRDQYAFPVACVATKREGGELVIAVSVHNPKDVFNRQRGHEIAAGRLRKGRHITRIPMPGAGEDVKLAVLEAVAKVFTTSSRLRNAAVFQALTRLADNKLAAKRGQQ